MPWSKCLRRNRIVIEYILGAFSGGFLVFMLMSVFVGRPSVIHEKEKELEEPSYHPDIHRAIDDDWEM